MAIDFSKVNVGDISLMANFGYYGDKPLDSRSVVPSLEGLQNLMDNGAAFAGLVTYVTSEERLYEVYDNEGALAYRPLTYTQAELNDIVGKVATAAMEFKGATATLPENPDKGDMYKVVAEFKVDDETVKVGDSIVYNGEQWFVIPSGDDIEDTWRKIIGVNNDADLTFVNGNNTTADVKATGEVTFHHNKLTAAPADITKEEDLVDADGNRIRTYLTAVEVDEYGHVTNFKTATETVEDTNTTYTFDGQVEDGASNVHFGVKASDADQADEIYLDAYTRNEVDALIEGVEDKIDGIDYSDFKTKQEEYSAAGSNKKTVAGVTQNANGEVEVTFEDIDFSHDHDAEYKKLQAAIDAVETEANEFVDTVAQDANGEITITTKKVDFGAYRTADDQDLIDATFKTKQDEYSATGSTVKTVTGIAQNANGEVEVTFEDIAFPELPTEDDFGVLSVSKADGTAITVDNTDAQNPVVGLAINNTGNVVLSQTNDGLSANVDLSHDHDAEYKKLQEAINAVATEDNEFIDTVAQTENGEVTITTKKVDFGAYRTADDQDIIDAGFKTKQEAYSATGSTIKTVTSVTQNENGEVAVAFEDIAFPEQTDYTVSIEEDTTDSTIAKRYIFKQLGEEIGRIDLAKELVVTSGSVQEVTEVDAPYVGAKVGDKYIELVIANQETPIYVPAKDLVDIYTAKELTTESTDEVKIAISNTNEISATLVDGKIAKAKLAKDLADEIDAKVASVTAGNASIAIGGTATEPTVAVKLSAAEGNAITLAEDGLKVIIPESTKVEASDTPGDGTIKVDGQGVTVYSHPALHAVSEIDKFTEEVAKVEVEKAKKADEATKATQDGAGNVITETYAVKATTLAGYNISDAYTKEETYAKTEVYTKAEVEAMLTWGEF